LLINSFLSVTNKNYKLAYTIGTFTDNALITAKADPAILALYNYFHPIFTSFQTSYNTWKTQQNTSIGGTATLDQLLGGLTAKVNLWDAQILGFYQTKTNAGYIALLPSGHSIFLHGKQKDRIDAVKHLSDGLVGIAGLAATKTDVDAYYNQLINAYNLHQGQGSGVGTSSDAVENQRVLLCNGLFYVYGGLIQKYVTDLKQIANFIDVESMQQHLQTQFTNAHLKPLATYNICQRTLAPNDQIKIINNGSIDLNFYWAAHASDAMGATFVTIAAGSEETHNASDFGDVDNLHFLNVFNTSPELDGSYELDLL
jgi:hypothetical protein